MIHQTTLRQAVSVRGIGLHTGQEVELTLCPAPPDTGYVFRRADLNGFEVLAAPHHVTHVSYATTLMRAGVMVSTVEHVLSALYGCGIDNAILDVTNCEVPILDGSALPFVAAIEAAGVLSLAAPRHVLRIERRIEVTEGNRRISIEPNDSFVIESTIDFDHPCIGRQTFICEVTPATYCQAIAPARTFGFLAEAEALRKHGLVRGATLANAIVLDADKMLNPEPLRFPDEFARHKVLDILGDFALLGMPIQGRITAERSGHGLHSALVGRLLREPSAWTISPSPSQPGLKVLAAGQAATGVTAALSVHG
ncbi:MAG: UDP-3-O-acyl-N-acetylglucosamine deacetylase [Chloracidobacterium sp.]|uniref:UDP-3-O-acyl-N-acetylglucosamine deacetylase n=2 Tax=Chloracidobacterium validum TaxID=2821543 RepID=A0ABX8BFR5_9BACT|nr:UDP-3-O-acyl-N-acetylglucosamine deacetylase [Chloracidobacterium validum]